MTWGLSYPLGRKPFSKPKFAEIGDTTLAQPSPSSATATEVQRSSGAGPADGGLSVDWKYPLAALLLSVFFFGLLRVDWIEQNLLLPYTGFQEFVACQIGGDPDANVVVNLSCSGADVIAMCLGFVLAFPVSWWSRLKGALGGLILISVANTIRIAILTRVAGTPRFELMHVYVLPAVLIVLVAAYVFLWMGSALGRQSGEAAPTSRLAGLLPSSPALRRFLVLTPLFVLAFFAAAPWWTASPMLKLVGAWVAESGGWVIRTLGGEAQVNRHVIRTANGAFAVTQECIISPLMPVYLAALFALPMSLAKRFLGLALFLPFFFVVGAARLLVLALPLGHMGSSLVAIHGFHQIVLGILLVALASWWVGLGRSAGTRGVATRALAGWAAGITVAAITGRLLGAALLDRVASFHERIGHGGHVYLDDQGAALTLAPYVIALFAALWVGTAAPRSWRSALAGTLLLLLSAAVSLVLAGEFQAHSGVEIHVAVLRAVAVMLPVSLAWLVFRRYAPGGAGRSNDGSDAGSWWEHAVPTSSKSSWAKYSKFWAGVGDNFPDLGGARSTYYYRRDEQRLLREHLPDLEGLKVMKTDMWDEAKNTRILRWAAEQGAEAYGVDISPPIVVAAKEGFGELELRAPVSDVRWLPYRDASFDAIYSMGTVEHFLETEEAVAEIFRVLKPGGRVILGVPNRLDPFLRPLMVAVMYKLGLYDYGYEKSFTRGGLRRMMEGVGFEVVAEDGILFIPGWLRIIDLAANTWAKPLGTLTGAASAFFGWISGIFPRLSRHGYLIASVGVRPVPDKE